MVDDDGAGLSRLARAFGEGTLPRGLWTHEAHLRVGLWHLLHYGPGEALDRLREGIRRYNAACGVADTATSGYHETITRFYMWAIRGFLDGAEGSCPVDALADELVRACGDRDLPLRYWSRERLFSPEARAGWVGPDLRPLEAGDPRVGV